MIYVYYSLIHKKILIEKIKENNEDVNYLELDAEKLRIKEIINLCLHVSLFDNKQNKKKIIIIENADFITFITKKDKDYNILIKFLEKLPNNIDLYFVIFNKNKLNIKADFKKIINNNNIVYFDIFKKYDWLKKYVLPEIKKRKINIDQNAIEELTKNTLNNYEHLQNEIEKISLYDENINLNNIKKIIFKLPENRIFELFNMLLKKDILKSLLIFYDLIKKKDINANNLLLILAKQFRFMYICNYLYTNTEFNNTKKIANLLKVHEFRVISVIKKNIININQKIMNILDNIYYLDYNIKNSKINSNIALELFIINFKI